MPFCTLVYMDTDLRIPGITILPICPECREYMHMLRMLTNTKHM